MICKNCNKEFGNGAYCQYCNIDRISAGADISNFPGELTPINTPNQPANTPNQRINTPHVDSYIQCPNCAEIISENSNFCPHCGKNPYQQCPNCKHQHSATNKYCPVCGKNPEDYYKQKEEERKRKEKEERRRKEEEERRLREEKEYEQFVANYVPNLWEYRNALKQTKNMLEEINKSIYIRRLIGILSLCGLLIVPCSILIFAGGFVPADHILSNITIASVLLGTVLLIVFISYDGVYKIKSKYKDNIILSSVLDEWERDPERVTYLEYPWQAKIYLHYKRIRAYEIRSEFIRRKSYTQKSM